MLEWNTTAYKFSQQVESLYMKTIKVILLCKTSSLGIAIRRMNSLMDQMLLWWFMVNVSNWLRDETKENGVKKELDDDFGIDGDDKYGFDV